MTCDDAQLLRRYAAEKSEAAFAELVRRHVDLVYAVALRRVNGDSHLAEDVAQNVFTDLARKAATLGKHPSLGAWLFRSTRFAAAQAMRSVKRRGAREQEAHLMQEFENSSASGPDWMHLRPVLEDVLDELPERDRIAVWLRVCEGRPFAEVGAKLAASEDAVRVRVDRALEKMRGSLARRGVVSTAAALSSALAQEAGIVAPAGLAASVTGTALTSAAAGGGVAAALGLSTFMSTTNGAGWSVAVAVLLASLAGNAYLLQQQSRPEASASFSAAANPTVSRMTEAAATPAAPVSLVKQEELAALREQLRAAGASDTAIRAALAKRGDLTALRDQLRAAGANEASIRAALMGILRRRYREQLSFDRADRMRRGWWRDDQRTWGTANDSQLPFDDLRLINEMVTQPLEQLLGVDPFDEAEADARYAFLPAALRQEFGRLDRAGIGGWTNSGVPEVDAAREAEFYENRRSVEEKRKKLMAELTAEQRADYEMRFGSFATGLMQQLESVGATEQEYRGVFPIADAYAKELATFPPGNGRDTRRDELDRQTMEKLVATLGYDRALDYIWANSRDYPAYARVAQEANLPSTTASQAVQLAATTADRAAAIHADPALTVEQKRAALIALQQTVRPQFDALIPATVQQRLAPSSLEWLTALGTGRYTLVGTVLPGQVRTLFGGGPISVEASVPTFRFFPSNLVPPRPPKG